MTVSPKYASIQTVSKFSDYLTEELNNTTDPKKQPSPLQYNLGVAIGLSQTFDYLPSDVDPQVPRVELHRVMTVFKEGLAQENEEGLRQIVDKLNRIVCSSLLNATPLYPPLASIVVEYM